MPERIVTVDAETLAYVRCALAAATATCPDAETLFLLRRAAADLDAVLEKAAAEQPA